MQISFGILEDHCRRQKKTMLDEIGSVIDFCKIEKLLLQLIREMEITHIKKQDHEYLKPMIQHQTQKVFADKAYTSQEHDEY